MRFSKGCIYNQDFDTCLKLQEAIYEAGGENSLTGLKPAELQQMAPARVGKEERHLYALTKGCLLFLVCSSPPPSPHSSSPRQKDAGNMLANPTQGATQLTSPSYFTPIQFIQTLQANCGLLRGNLVASSAFTSRQPCLASPQQGLPTFFAETSRSSAARGETKRLRSSMDQTQQKYLYQAL